MEDNILLKYFSSRKDLLLPDLKRLKNTGKFETADREGSAFHSTSPLPLLVVTRTTEDSSSDRSATTDGRILVTLSPKIRYWKVKDNVSGIQIQFTENSSVATILSGSGVESTVVGKFALELAKCVQAPSAENMNPFEKVVFEARHLLEACVYDILQADFDVSKNVFWEQYVVAKFQYRLIEERILDLEPRLRDVLCKMA